MASARGIEREFGDLYITEQSDAQRPQVRNFGAQQHRQGPSPFKNGLPSFKPVVYPNPDGPDSDDDRNYYMQRTNPVKSSYRSDSPPSMQGRREIPVYHTTSAAYHPQQMAPSVSYGDGRPHDSPVQYHIETKYVGPGGQTGDFYDDDDYVPPAVPLKGSYGSVTSSTHTPQIAGPQYRIASPAYGTDPGSYSSPRQAAPQTRYPEPVSSKLMFTTPSTSGYVADSHHTSEGSTGTARPQPSSHNQTYTPPGGQQKFTSSASITPQSGLYNYSLDPRETEPEEEQLGEDKKEAEVDALTQMLMQNMEAAADPDFFGMCAKCGRSIMGENTGCSALDKLYHTDCFSCAACDQSLGGQPFFAMEGKPYCEPCYMNTLEKCSVCSKPITDRILRATGKPYHPGCFTCVVCGKSLDGIPFTVDATNQIHCIEDFHKKFAPRCCVCGEPIMPENGEEETVRIVAIDRSFHVGCYTCEDCGMVLSSEAEGRGCYPLDDHILCKNCNAKRIQTMTTKMTTEL